MERVVLVDDQDKEIGTEEKLKAHRAGKLHRAVSIFIFNDNQEMLLQQRAYSKYHSGGCGRTAVAAIRGRGRRPLERQRGA